MLLSAQAATVIDLSLSRNYLAGHIPGAWFAIRSRLARAMAHVAAAGTLVLTSEDGVLASLAVNEAARCATCRSAISKAATRRGRRPERRFSTDAKLADDAVDQWRKPYERSGDIKAAMAEYLAWETDLLPRIERDGTLKFFHLGA